MGWNYGIAKDGAGDQQHPTMMESLSEIFYKIMLIGIWFSNDVTILHQFIYYDYSFYIQ